MNERCVLKVLMECDKVKFGYDVTRKINLLKQFVILISQNALS